VYIHKNISPTTRSFLAVHISRRKRTDFSKSGMIRLIGRCGLRREEIKRLDTNIYSRKSNSALYSI
jgi:hypothetical protein